MCDAMCKPLLTVERQANIKDVETANGRGRCKLNSWTLSCAQNSQHKQNNVWSPIMLKTVYTYNWFNGSFQTPSLNPLPTQLLYSKYGFMCPLPSLSAINAPSTNINVFWPSFVLSCLPWDHPHRRKFSPRTSRLFSKQILEESEQYISLLLPQESRSSTSTIATFSGSPYTNCTNSHGFISIGIDTDAYNFNQDRPNDWLSNI